MTSKVTPLEKTKSPVEACLRPKHDHGEVMAEPKQRLRIAQTKDPETRYDVASVRGIFAAKGFE